MKYVCDVCGWVYDEEEGAPDMGIAPGTKFEDLPEELEKNGLDEWRENLYKVILTGDMRENVVLSPEGIKSWLSEVFFLKIKDRTRITVDYEQVAKQRTLKGMFVAKMLKCIKEAENKGDFEKKAVLKEALSIGLKAFYTEVGYDVDE